jgi:aspartate dehydrogenase
MTAPRVLMIGHGAIGATVAKALQAEPFHIGAFLLRPGRKVDRFPCFHDAAGAFSWKPDLVVECAGHDAVRDAVPDFLAAGIDAIIVSIGALADPGTEKRIEDAARRGGARASLVSGAVGGLDALRAARLAGLERVVYTGRKPPAAWAGAPGAERAAAAREPLAIFTGEAGTAARLYPKNANVTAAVALAGIGFQRTIVTLIADPGIAANIHEVSAEGAFGHFRFVIENAPLPGNPRSSHLAALSVEAAIRSRFDSLQK